MRLGLFGGTFDPIHYGHLAVLSEAQRAFELDEVLLVPAAQSPLRGAARAPARHRLEMCELAARGRTGIAVTDIELTREAPSYTADTLDLIRRQRPGDEVYVVIGADALNALLCWRDIGRIVAHAAFISITRSAHRNTPPPELLAAFPQARNRLHTHEMPAVDISSSRVRSLIADGRQLHAYLPPPVEEYIRRHGLYGLAAPRCSPSI